MAEQVTAPTMTRILDGLEQSSFITRTASKQDRRMIEVQATAEGRDALEQAETRRVRWLASELARLDVADRARVADALDTLDRLDEKRGH